MADQLQLRGGTTAEHSTFTGALREVTVDTDKDTVVVHDGSTAGGHPLAKQNLSNVPAGTITSTMIADGTIVNADINASAAIDKTKISGTAITAGDTGTVTSTMIADGTIVNADVNASAAIAGTKISPDFGSQTIQTTGVVSHALGTAAAPTLTFTGDTNTGIYSPGADQVAISTGGSGRLFVDASGRVGVGTSTLSALLHIGGTTAPTLKIEDTDNGFAPLEISATNGGRDFTLTTNQDYYFNNATTTYMTIQSSGNVGVGTSSPGYQLEVGSGATDATALFNSTAATGSHIRFGRSGTVDGYFGCATGFLTSGTAAGDIGIRSQGALVLGSGGNNNRIFIASAGNVGIGTSSPQTILDLASGSPTIQFTDTTSAGERNWRIGISDIVEGDFNITQETGDDTNTYASRFYINLSGNVGIGTTSPSRLLHISAASGDTPVRIQTATTGAFLEFQDSATTAGRQPLVGAIGDNLVVYTSAGSYSERARFDSSGRLLVGTSSARSVGVGSAYPSRLQIETTAYAGLSIVNNTNDGNGAILAIGKSRGTAAGGITSVNNGDEIGVVRFAAADGTDLESISAQISCEADGGVSGNDVPGRLVFSTTADGASSPTERMRIRSNGAMWGFSTDDAVQVLGDSRAAGTTVSILLRCSATAVNTGSDVYRVLTNGNVQNSNNSYGSISDIKLKENIVDANSQWDDIKALQVRNYNFKEGQTHTQIGLVAQEVELVSPGLVSESHDRDEDGNDLGTTTKSVNYSVLYMKAVKALQEAMERIEQLEAEMAEVKAQLS